MERERERGERETKRETETKGCLFPSYFVLLSSSFFLLPSSLILIPSSLFRLVSINRKSSPPIPMSSSSPAVASTFNVTSKMPQSLYGREEERKDEREERERRSDIHTLCVCVCVCGCVCVFDAIANKTLFSSSFLRLFFVSSSLYQRSLRDPAHPLRLLRAAQEGRVFALDGNRYFARPSPSLAGEKLIYNIYSVLTRLTICTII